MSMYGLFDPRRNLIWEKGADGQWKQVPFRGETAEDDMRQQRAEQAYTQETQATQKKAVAEKRVDIEPLRSALSPWFNQQGYDYESQTNFLTKVTSSPQLMADAMRGEARQTGGLGLINPLREYLEQNPDDKVVKEGLDLAVKDLSVTADFSKYSGDQEKILDVAGFMGQMGVPEGWEDKTWAQVGGDIANVYTNMKEGGASDEDFNSWFKLNEQKLATDATAARKASAKIEQAKREGHIKQFVTSAIAIVGAAVTGGASLSTLGKIAGTQSPELQQFANLTEKGVKTAEEGIDIGMPELKMPEGTPQDPIEAAGNIIEDIIPSGDGEFDPNIPTTTTGQDIGDILQPEAPGGGDLADVDLPTDDPNWLDNFLNELGGMGVATGVQGMFDLQGADKYRDWKNQQLEGAEARLGLQSRQAGLEKQREEEDYARDLETMRRTQHVQNLVAKESLARKGMLSGGASTIRESELGRLKEEQTEAKTGRELLRQRSLENIGLKMEAANLERQQSAEETERWYETNKPTWEKTIRSRFAPQAVAGALEAGLDLSGSKLDISKYL